jgi:hypothetical protein
VLGGEAVETLATEYCGDVGRGGRGLARVLRPMLTVSAARVLVAHFGEAVGVDPRWAGLTPGVDDNGADATGRARACIRLQQLGESMDQPRLTAAPLLVAARVSSRVWPKAVMDWPAVARTSLNALEVMNRLRGLGRCAARHRCQGRGLCRRGRISTSR